MKTLLIQPAVRRLVRDPKTQEILADKPTEVQATSYWLRRLRMGDVVLVEEQPKAAPKKKTMKQAEPEAAQEE